MSQVCWSEQLPLRIRTKPDILASEFRLVTDVLAPASRRHALSRRADQPAPAAGRARRARDDGPGPRPREPRRPDLRRHDGPGPGPARRTTPAAGSPSPATPPPASAARSSTSCAASTGPRARSAAAPATSTRPATSSPPPSVASPPTPRWPRLSACRADEVARNEDDIARAQVLSSRASEDARPREHLLPTAGPTPEQIVEHRERLTYLVEAVAELPERLRTVVEQYFLAERPMAEIAEPSSASASRGSPRSAPRPWSCCVAPSTARSSPSSVVETGTSHRLRRPSS